MRRRVRFFWLLGIVMPALALLAACSSAASQATAPPPTSAEDTGENVDTLAENVEQVGSNLPADFPVTVYQGAEFQDGEQVMFSELVAQGKPVVLNFWAGLCPPCRLEMPDLQAINDEYVDRILLFGLDVGPFTALGSNEDGRRLLRDLEITYPAGTTSDSDVVRQYEIRGMPSTYFITPDGQLIREWTGLLTEERLAELVEELLAASTES